MPENGFSVRYCCEFQLVLVPQHGQIPTGAEKHKRNFAKRDRHKIILPRGVYGIERPLAQTLCLLRISQREIKKKGVNKGLGKELS